MFIRTPLAKSFFPTALSILRAPNAAVVKKHVSDIEAAIDVFKKDVDANKVPELEGRCEEKLFQVMRMLCEVRFVQLEVKFTDAMTKTFNELREINKKQIIAIFDSENSEVNTLNGYMLFSKVVIEVLLTPANSQKLHERARLVMQCIDLLQHHQLPVSILAEDREPRNEVEEYLYELLNQHLKKLFEFRAWIMGDVCEELKECEANRESPPKEIHSYHHVAVANDGLIGMDACIRQLNLFLYPECRRKYQLDFEQHELALANKKWAPIQSGLLRGIHGREQYRAAILHVLNNFDVFYSICGRGAVKGANEQLPAYALKRLATTIQYDVARLRALETCYQESVYETRYLRMVDIYLSLFASMLGGASTEFFLDEDYHKIKFKDYARPAFGLLLNYRTTLLLGSPHDIEEDERELSQAEMSAKNSARRLVSYEILRKEIKKLIELYAPVAIDIKEFYAPWLMEYYVLAIANGQTNSERLLIYSLNDEIARDIRPHVDPAKVAIYNFVCLASVAMAFNATVALQMLRNITPALAALAAGGITVNPVILSYLFQHIGRVVNCVRNNGGTAEEIAAAEEYRVQVNAYCEKADSEAYQLINDTYHLERCYQPVGLSLADFAKAFSKKKLQQFEARLNSAFQGNEPAPQRPVVPTRINALLKIALVISKLKEQAEFDELRMQLANLSLHKISLTVEAAPEEQQEKLNECANNFVRLLNLLFVFRLNQDKEIIFTDTQKAELKDLTKLPVGAHHYSMVSLLNAYISLSAAILDLHNLSDCTESLEYAKSIIAEIYRAQRLEAEPRDVLLKSGLNALTSQEVSTNEFEQYGYYFKKLFFDNLDRHKSKLVKQASEVGQRLRQAEKFDSKKFATMSFPEIAVLNEHADIKSHYSTVRALQCRLLSMAHIGKEDSPFRVPVMASDLPSEERVIRLKAAVKTLLASLETAQKLYSYIVFSKYPELKKFEGTFLTMYLRVMAELAFEMMLVLEDIINTPGHEVMLKREMYYLQVAILYVNICRSPYNKQAKSTCQLVLPLYGVEHIKFDEHFSPTIGICLEVILMKYLQNLTSASSMGIFIKDFNRLLVEYTACAPEMKPAALRLINYYYYSCLVALSTNTEVVLLLPYKKTIAALNEAANSGAMFKLLMELVQQDRRVKANNPKACVDVYIALYAVIESTMVNNKCQPESLALSPMLYKYLYDMAQGCSSIFKDGSGLLSDHPEIKVNKFKLFATALWEGQTKNLNQLVDESLGAVLESLSAKNEPAPTPAPAEEKRAKPVVPKETKNVIDKKKVAVASVPLVQEPKFRASEASFTEVVAHCGHANVDQCLANIKKLYLPLLGNRRQRHERVHALLILAEALAYRLEEGGKKSERQAIFRDINNASANILSFASEAEKTKYQKLIADWNGFYERAALAKKAAAEAKAEALMKNAVVLPAATGDVKPFTVLHRVKPVKPKPVRVKVLRQVDVPPRVMPRLLRSVKYFTVLKKVKPVMRALTSFNILYEEFVARPAPVAPQQTPAQQEEYMNKAREYRSRYRNKNKNATSQQPSVVAAPVVAVSTTAKIYQTLPADEIDLLSAFRVETDHVFLRNFAMKFPELQQRLVDLFLYTMKVETFVFDQKVCASIYGVPSLSVSFLCLTSNANMLKVLNDPQHKAKLCIDKAWLDEDSNTIAVRFDNTLISASGMPCTREDVHVTVSCRVPNATQNKVQICEKICEQYRFNSVLFCRVSDNALFDVKGYFKTLIVYPTVHLDKTYDTAPCLDLASVQEGDIPRNNELIIDAFMKLAYFAKFKMGMGYALYDFIQANKEFLPALQKNELPLVVLDQLFLMGNARAVHDWVTKIFDAGKYLFPMMHEYYAGDFAEACDQQDAKAKTIPYANLTEKELKWRRAEFIATTFYNSFMYGRNYWTYLSKDGRHTFSSDLSAFLRKLPFMTYGEPNSPLRQAIYHLAWKKFESGVTEFLYNEFMKEAAFPYSVNDNSRFIADFKIHAANVNEDAVVIQTVAERLWKLHLAMFEKVAVTAIHARP